MFGGTDSLSDEMIPTFLASTIILLTGAAMSLILAVRVWRLRRTKLGSALLGLMICSFFYSLGYAFELTSGTLASILIWNKVQYLGVSFIPAFWILLTARYSGKDGWLKPPILAILFAVSYVTVLLDLSSPGHPLYYRSLSLEATAGHPVLHVVPGPWYWVHIGYSTAAFLLGTILLVGMFRHRWRSYRRQAGVMLVGSAFPWIGMLIYLAGWSPYGLDTSPLALAMAIPLLAWAVFRYKVFDLAPVAKDKVFAGMRDGTIVLDALDRIVDFNPAALVLPGLSSEALGRTLKDSIPRHPELQGLVKSEQPKEIDVKIDGPSGPRSFRAHAVLIRDRRSTPLFRILSFHEITEQVRLMENLREMAIRDDLTGSYNRTYFRDISRTELARAKRYGRAISVLILDLDEFKSVNDTWGHEAGDTVLKAVAGILRAGLRTSDVLCRHGGEEFAILLPETPPSRSIGVAERLRAQLAESSIPIREGGDVRITASFGIAGADRVGDDTIDDLLRSADQAMYRAKAAGRNCIFTAPQKSA